MPDLNARHATCIIVLDALLVAGLLASSALAQPAPGDRAYAQSQKLQVAIANTEDGYYRTGDLVTISGNAGTVKPGQQQSVAIIQVYNARGALARTDFAAVTADGTFSYSYIIAGKLNQYSGTYRAVVTFAGESKELEFAYISTDPELVPYTILSGNRTFVIAYGIPGGRVERIEADLATQTLALFIDATSSGKLTVRYPKSLFWSGDPVVLADETEAPATWQDLVCESILTAEFEAGTETVEIIGTFLISSYPGAFGESKGFSQDLTIRANNLVFTVPVVMNADSCSDLMLMQEEKRLHVEVQGPADVQGYFQVTLPHRLLGGSYSVLLDGEPVPAADFVTKYNPGGESRVEQDTTTISVSYDGRKTRSIDVVGTTVVPEFSSAPLAGAAGASAIVIAAAAYSGRMKRKET